MKTNIKLVVIALILGFVIGITTDKLKAQQETKILTTSTLIQDPVVKPDTPGSINITEGTAISLYSFTNSHVEFKFDPQPDITTYELALILNEFAMVIFVDNDEEKNVLKQHPYLRRHLKPLYEKEEVKSTDGIMPAPAGTGITKTTNSSITNN